MFCPMKGSDSHRSPEWPTRCLMSVVERTSHVRIEHKKEIELPRAFVSPFSSSSIAKDTASDPPSIVLQHVGSFHTKAAGI